ncbi:PucR family transcriptional regulator [Aquibacillus albus]|uniref:Purine catabolism regulator n=1 Tax=Aquibacillus albus TaxID=1168171 RepID=A0ABS2N5Q5_9BACI|nr:PucR family transcriptional regulator [Aquibacillus albus]MBM7573452.1 purine catabolism regulator [Aquibacillus albus]
MGITVKEALNIGALKKGELLAGHGGLDNLINHVSVIEVPDAHQWFRGNELFLTAFYTIRDDVKVQIELLENLKQKGSAALGICYPGLYYNQLSEDTKSKANELNIPIIEVPTDVAYIDIISPILKEIEREQFQDIHHAVHVQNQVHEWIVQGADLQKITLNISKLINEPILIMDQQFHVLTSSYTSMQPFRLEQLESFIGKNMNEIHQKNNTCFSWVEKKQNIHLYPIKIKRKFYGYIVIPKWKDEHIKITPLVFDNLSTGLALYFSQKLFIKDAENKIKKNLLDEWLTSEEVNRDVFLDRSKKLEWDIFEKAGIGLLSYSGEHYYLEDILGLIKRFFISKGNYTISFTYGEKIILFLQNQSNFQDYYRGLFEALCRFLTEEGVENIHVCLSPSTKQLIRDGRHFFEEVNDTLNVQKKLNMLPSILFSNEVPIFSATFMTQDKRLLRKMEELLQPLVQYDNKNNSDLLETLGYLLFSKDSNELPEKLNVHRNTLNYRKNRIRDLLTNDPFISPYRMSYELAILIRKMTL